jgi:hypothetical protein
LATGRNELKTYTLKLTADQAELLDIAMSIAVAEAQSRSPKYRELQQEIQRQFEAQD